MRESRHWHVLSATCNIRITVVHRSTHRAEQVDRHHEDHALVKLRTAARLRAHYGTLRTPDALQLAAAISTGCHAFVTNDRRIPAPDGLRVLQLSEVA